MTKTIAIVIFDEVEVLDFCGPFEVFSVANRDLETPAFEVLLVAKSLNPIRTRGGMVVLPHRSWAEMPEPTILLVPGGYGTRKEMKNAELLTWVQRASAKAELVLSVCTGSLVLAKAGLLEGLEATTHHLALDLLQEVGPNVQVSREKRVVDNGKVVCSAGIAAGIDMSLHVVSRLLGAEKARATAAYMEYPYAG
jgi:transcriptional regulator GlxA family with amidase domain